MATDAQKKANTKYKEKEIRYSKSKFNPMYKEISKIIRVYDILNE